jgi:hypothetical protein
VCRLFRRIRAGTTGGELISSADGSGIAELMKEVGGRPAADGQKSRQENSLVTHGNFRSFVSYAADYFSYNKNWRGSSGNIRGCAGVQVNAWKHPVAVQQDAPSGFFAQLKHAPVFRNAAKRNHYENRLEIDS